MSLADITTCYDFLLRLPIPLLLKYPTRYGSSVGAHRFTLEEEGSGKVRGQSVDITTKGPDHSVEVWANFVPNMSERVGFEPTIRLPTHRFLSSAPVVLPCHDGSCLAAFIS